MKAGLSNIDVNAKVEIVKNTHGEKEDNKLIGRTGQATHPFAFGETKKGWIGIYLDDELNGMTKVNVHQSEVKIVED